ncbi:MAG: GIY-YIG nuclease family protein [Chloroflexota bacterium]|nr:GIY-YIG nuclease family protein [Chloroflexota bacterium]
MSMTRTWVYILRCSDSSYYTGRTNNLKRRLAKHHAGDASEWTCRRLPVELLFAQEFSDSLSAYHAEHQILP